MIVRRLDSRYSRGIGAHRSLRLNLQWVLGSLVAAIHVGHLASSENSALLVLLWIETGTIAPAYATAGQCS